MPKENTNNKQIYSESYVLNTDKIAQELKKIKKIRLSG